MKLKKTFIIFIVLIFCLSVFNRGVLLGNTSPDDLKDAEKKIKVIVKDAKKKLDDQRKKDEEYRKRFTKPRKIKVKEKKAPKTKIPLPLI